LLPTVSDNEKQKTKKKTKQKKKNLFYSGGLTYITRAEFALSPPIETQTHLAPLSEKAHSELRAISA
jgi:hypothetical protein